MAYGIAGMRSIPASAGEPCAGNNAGDRIQVYPRVCGGTEAYPNDNVTQDGLSPRLRGNQIPTATQSCQSGSIPASAGEPSAVDMAARNALVYPRVCGGTPVATNPASGRAGLSPRLRGNHWPPVDRSCPGRSIPASAGEPRREVVRPCLHEVYPRVCGGTAEDGTPFQAKGGLSPRLRGNPNFTFDVPSASGSIPASAGEPPRARSQEHSSRVYPRVCGGTADLQGLSPEQQGLSPRLRGNLIELAKKSINPGSIPASAGEPEWPPSGSKLNRVYPRVCGGTGMAALRKQAQQGLSPRLRGNPEPMWHGLYLQRSIPASAGEPHGRPWAGLLRTVYPRVCGGTVASISQTRRPLGLSPRLRGNHRGRNHHCH